MRIRTYIATASALLVLAASVLQSGAARAFDFDFEYSEIDQATGESHDVQCEAADIQDSLDRLKSGYLEQVVKNAPLQLLRMLPAYAAQIAACILQSSEVLGSSPPDAYQCALNVGGDMGNALETQYLNQLEANFNINCTARSQLTRSVKDARKIIAENGRDGGPAFVTDYQTFMAQSRNRGQKIALNQMANTDYCPWLQSPLQAMFNFSAANAVAPSNNQRDGSPTYMDTAACNAPAGYNPFDPKWQTAEGQAILMQPENNLWGAYLLAQENIEQQVADAEKQDEYEFVYTGGLGALHEKDTETGTGCRTYAADGSTCLEYGTITQPAAGVQAEVQAQRQAQYDWITNPRPEDITDPYAQLITSLLSATTDPIETEYRLSRSTQQIADDPSSTLVTPRPTAGGGGGGGSCAYASLQGCTCADDLSSAVQLIATTAVQNAVLAAIQQQTGYSVTADGNSVLAGQERVFLDAVCHAGTFTAGETCRLNGSSATEILMLAGGYDWVVSVLNGSTILKPGAVVAACLTGIL